MKDFYKNFKKFVWKKGRPGRTWQGRIRDLIVPFLYEVILPSTDHIIFAAHARCKGCGAGLGYKCSASMHGEWDCSNALLGKVDTYEKNEDGSFKHPTFPFAFYEIKSENQPSANGATTRPPEIKPSPWYTLWSNINDWSNAAEAKRYK